MLWEFETVQKIIAGKRREGCGDFVIVFFDKPLSGWAKARLRLLWIEL